MSNRALIKEAKDIAASRADRHGQQTRPRLYDPEGADLLNRLATALSAFEWRPIEEAPRDGELVEVYAPSPNPAKWHDDVCTLPPIVTLARWHPDAGYTVCEIREVTHWRPHTPPEDARCLEQEGVFIPAFNGPAEYSLDGQVWHDAVLVDGVLRLPHKSTTLIMRRKRLPNPWEVGN